jgi:hypothetical protein
MVVWSENAMQSREVRAEATYALNENKLLPVRIDPVKIWARYNIVQYDDVLHRPPDRDPNWPEVIRHLSAKVGLAPKPNVFATPPAANDGAPAPQPRASKIVEISDKPVLPPGIAAPALLMSASGLSLIAWLAVPLFGGPDTNLPLYAATAFAAMAIGIAAATLLRPARTK